MKTPIRVAVIENFRVSRITLVDEWFLESPQRQIDLADISQLDPKPEVGWFYIKGRFYPELELKQILFRLKTLTTHRT